ncbi:60S ribosomal protein L24-like [Spinacia oleracea]|uniref:60S ribosomal protein L24-like n=1 Tax=Spinacia oleracea TaxID=3562 RepID=A0ABM3R7X9_SPIOL|nr:60S ribosomal protein L24-like [Spinacia oleracea]
MRIEELELCVGFRLGGVYFVCGWGSSVHRYGRKQCFQVRTKLRHFTGAKIYLGRGIRFVRSDSQVFLFVNSKYKRYFYNRFKPSKLSWTAVYLKQHKNDILGEAVKRRRATKKPYSRSIVGATLEVIQKKRP